MIFIFFFTKAPWICSLLCLHDAFYIFIGYLSCYSINKSPSTPGNSSGLSKKFVFPTHSEDKRKNTFFVCSRDFVQRLFVNSIKPHHMHMGRYNCWNADFQQYNANRHCYSNKIIYRYKLSDFFVSGIHKTLELENVVPFYHGCTCTLKTNTIHYK